MRRRPRRRSARVRRRKVVGALVLLVLLGVSVGVAKYFLGDERIRGHTIEAIESLSGGEVELDNATLSVLQHIRIQGLRVYLPGQEHKQENLVFAADDVILKHEPLSILRRRLVIKEIIAEGAQLNIWYDIDRGITNLQLFRFEPAGADESPRVFLRESLISYREISQGRSSSLLLQQIAGRIDPVRYNEGVIRFEIRSLEKGLLTEFSLRGTYDKRTHQLITQGNFFLEAVHVEGLPGRLADWRRLYEDIEPSGEVQSVTTFDPQAGYMVQMELQGGRLKLPLTGVDYKIPLQDVKGKVVLNNKMIKIEDLQGNFENEFTLALKGNLNGYLPEGDYEVTLQTKGLSIPAGQWDELSAKDLSGIKEGQGHEDTSLQLLFHTLYDIAPGWLQGFVQNTRPTGEFDVHFQVSKERGEGNHVKIEGPVIVHNGSFLYHQFPYLIDKVKGEFLLESDRATIGPMSGRHGEGFITITGEHRQSPKGSALDISVDGRNIALDNDLYTALPGWSQQVWNDFVPSGRIDCLYAYHLEPGEQGQEDLDLDLVNVSAAYQRIPIPLTAIQGKVLWNPRLVTLDINQAQCPGGRVRLHGRIENLYQPGQMMDFQGECEDMLINDDIADNLVGPLDELERKFGLRGKFSGRGRVWTEIQSRPEVITRLNSDEPAPKWNYDIDFDLGEGRINYERFPYPLADMSARGRMSTRELRIDDFKGRNGESLFEMSGLFPKDGPFQIDVDCQKLEMSEQLRRSLEVMEINIWDRVKPSGKMNVSLHFEQGSAEDKSDLNYQIKIEPLGGGFQPQAFAYPFRNVTGGILAEPGHITLTDVVSHSDSTIITTSGELKTRAGSREYDLQVTTRSLELDERLRDALGKRGREFWGRHEPGGRVDLDLDIDYRQEAAEGGIWNFKGVMDIHEGKGKFPQRAENITGQIKGQAYWDSRADYFMLTGELECAELLFMKRAMTGLTADVEFNGREKSMTLSDISSGLCDGRLAGGFETSSDPNQGTYNLDLQFLEVNLEQFLNAGKESSSQHYGLRGRFDGWLSMCRQSPQEQRRGSFGYIITEAVLGELPLVGRLLHVINLSLPRAGAFNEAEIYGNIVGERAYFDILHLRGSALSLAGTGTMKGLFSTDQDIVSDKETSDKTKKTIGHDNTLDLVFLVDAPGYLDGIPILSSFYQAIRGGLMQLRVSGSFEEPRVESVALPILGDALQPNEE
ncbi:MAG: hypothetical protein JW860_11360 [Sedimentisphaerales bacterium]|nr:hypothetical protein [Sedimentisphaerales bacterium]